LVADLPHVSPRACPAATGSASASTPRSTNQVVRFVAQQLVAKVRIARPSSRVTGASVPIQWQRFLYGYARCVLALATGRKAVELFAAA